MGPNTRNGKSAKSSVSPKPSPPPTSQSSSSSLISTRRQPPPAATLSPSNPIPNGAQTFSSLSRSAHQVVENYRFVVTPHQWQRIVSTDVQQPARVYYISPSGRVLRTEQELRRYLTASSAPGATICRCYIPSLPFEDVFSFDPNLGSIGLPRPKPNTKVVLSPCAALLSRGKSPPPDAIEKARKAFYASLISNRAQMRQRELGVEFPCFLTRAQVLYSRHLADWHWRHLACEYRSVWAPSSSSSSVPIGTSPTKPGAAAGKGRKILRHESDDSDDVVFIEPNTPARMTSISIQTDTPRNNKSSTTPSTSTSSSTSSNSFLKPLSMAKNAKPTSLPSDDEYESFNLQASMMVSVQLTEEATSSSDAESSHSSSTSPVKSCQARRVGTSILALNSGAARLQMPSPAPVQQSRAPTSIVGLRPQAAAASTDGRSMPPPQPRPPPLINLRSPLNNSPNRRSSPRLPPSPQMSSETATPETATHDDQNGVEEEEEEEEEESDVSSPAIRPNRIQIDGPGPELSSRLRQRSQPSSGSAHQVQPVNQITNYFTASHKPVTEPPPAPDLLFPVKEEILDDDDEENDKESKEVDPSKKKPKKRKRIVLDSASKKKKRNKSIAPVIIKPEPVEEEVEFEVPVGLEQPVEPPVMASPALEAAEGAWRCNYPHCNRIFDQRSNLMAHARIHRRVKPFVCSWLLPTGQPCGYVSEFRRIVARHVETRHFEIPKTPGPARDEALALETRTVDDYIEHVKEDGTPLTMDEEQEERRVNPRVYEENN